MQHSFAFLHTPDSFQERSPQLGLKFVVRRLQGLDEAQLLVRRQATGLFQDGLKVGGASTAHPASLRQTPRLGQRPHPAGPWLLRGAWGWCWG